MTYLINIFEYLADGEHTKSHWQDETQYHWMFKRPSIHMPKEAARIFIRVKDVRIERLQDITTEQAKAEGVDLSSGTPFPQSTARDCHGAKGELSMYQVKFILLWDSLIKEPDVDKNSWMANPWVWVIEFERISKEEALQG